MSTSQCTKGLKKILAGQIVLSTATLKAVMVDTEAGALNLDTIEFLSEIPLADRVATSLALTGKAWSIDTGVSPHQVVFDADDTVFSAVSGDPTEAVIIIEDTGAAATSSVLFYMDGASVSLTPNGNDVDLKFHANGIARWRRG